MRVKHTYKKEERLKSNRVIKTLFSSARNFLVHPFKVNWQLRKDNGRYPARVLISVSKKHFRKASERNDMKRLIREAYRIHKHILYEFLEDKGVQCDFSVIYIAKEAEAYSEVEKKIIKLLNRLISELELHLHQNNPTS